MAGKITLKPNDTIVFIGDSITDTGRSYPAYQPFGYGYVNFTANILLAKYPQLNLNIVNAGISGNTIRTMKPRWKKDCVAHNPDVVSVMIGINDLWRQYIEPERQCEAVYPDEYEATYRELLSQLRDNCNPQLVMMEPFMFCDDKHNKMFEGLSIYIKIVNKLAKEFDAVLIKLQTAIEQQIGKVPSGKWSDDFVHPHLWAHAWIALQWLSATGL